jgi:hypothetical protein
VSGVRTLNLAQSTGVRCELIAADPPPRYWRNYTTVINEWKVQGVEYDATKKDWVQFDAVARSQQSVNANGYRAGSVSTDIAEGPDHDPQMVADHLLPVTKDVYWCVDNITVILTPETLADVKNNLAKLQAMGLARSPSRHGYVMAFDLEQAKPAMSATGMVLCVVESKQVDWRADGWQITVATSHPAMYDAAFNGLGPDPTRTP